MPETNEIMVPDGLETGSLVVSKPQDIRDMAKTADYLQRVQITGSNSDIVQNQKIEAGFIVLVQDKEHFVDLGKEVDMIFYTMRPKALQIDQTAGQILQFFDRSHSEFKRIQAQSAIRDSGCMFGLEFLVYLPNREQFASFYCGSKSGRKESPNILDIMNVSDDPDNPIWKPAAITIKPKFIPKAPGRKYSWWSFEVFKCSSPLAAQPEMEELKTEVEKFNTPPKSTVEKAEPVAGAGADRER